MAEHTHVPRSAAHAREGASGRERADARQHEGPAGPDGLHAGLLALQATAGNRAVTRLLGKDGDAPPAFAEPGPGVAALASGAWTLKKHPSFPGTMGQTFYARHLIEQWPSFNLDVSRSYLPPFDYEVKPKATDAAGAAWPVTSTPESEEGYKMADEHPQHPGYEYWIRVSGTAANTVAGAEQQHANDLDAGWSLTGLAAKQAINKAAAEDPATGDTVAAAKSAAVDKVVGHMGGLGGKIRSALEGGGRLESALGPMMDAAFTASKVKRDDSGKHRHPIQYVMKDDERKRVLYEADPDHAPDTQSTSEVVNLGSISG